MTIQAKLQHLTQTSNRSEVARLAGIRIGAISGVLRNRNAPKADVAFRMARALGVDLAWLLDDERELPAVMAGQTLRTAESGPDDDARRIIHQAAETLRGPALWIALHGVSGAMVHLNTVQTEERAMPASEPATNV